MTYSQYPSLFQVLEIKKNTFLILIVVLFSSINLNSQSCVDFDGMFAARFIPNQNIPSNDYSDGFVSFSNSGSWEVLQCDPPPVGDDFRLTGFSAPNALKWSSRLFTGNTESILFQSPVENVTFNIGSPNSFFTSVIATFEAFDSAGNNLGTINTNIVTSSLITISFPFSNISRIDLTIADDPDREFTAGCLDDICYTVLPVTPVPTMGQWGLICLGLLLLIVGVTSVKSREIALG